jgi:3-oxoacyl-[acyl-carrier protein] reductase
VIVSASAAVTDATDDEAAGDAEVEPIFVRVDNRRVMTRTALVTGASGGIGSATARELGRDHDVVVHYHSDRESADAVAEDVRASGQAALVHQCDVRDPAAVEEMVARAREAVGGIDVLVNNAGVFQIAPVETASDEMIQQTLRVNLEGAVYCARAVLPDMRENGEGWIVNVSSTAGTNGSPNNAVYGASKSGLLGFTKSLAKQYTADGIFANAVAPGPVTTEMYPEERRPAAREASPIDRLVTPEEVADVVRTFATTSTITGETLVVDGGYRL